MHFPKSAATICMYVCMYALVSVPTIGSRTVLLQERGAYSIVHVHNVQGSQRNQMTGLNK